MRSLIRLAVHSAILVATAFVLTGCCCGLPLAGSFAGLDDVSGQLPARAEVPLR